MNFEWLGRQSDRIMDLVGWHVLLSLIPLVIGLVVALPIGWVAYRSRRLHPYVVGPARLLYTIRRSRSSCSCLQFWVPRFWIR